MAELLRAGVVGLHRGASFVRLLQAIKGVRVVAVADLDSARVEAMCQQHDVGSGYGSLTEMLGADLDFVVVATPVPQHVAHVCESLEAGVAVLSEVPAIASAGEADTLVTAVERSGRPYMMAENCCYWAFVDTVQRLCDQGLFGTIFYSEAEYIHNIPELRRDTQGRPTWRASLEPITYITHSLGPIMWVTGQYPFELTCYGSAGHFEPGYVDVQVAIIKMTDGSVARITCSFANAHWSHHRFVFFGTKATLDTRSLGRDEPRLWAPSRPDLPGDLPLGTSFPQAGASPSLGGHGTAEWYMVRDWLRALREGTRPPVDVYDAVMQSLPGLLASQSAREGRPVAIPQYQTSRPVGRG